MCLVVVSLTESDRRFLSAVGRKLNPPDHLTLNSCPERPDQTGSGSGFRVRLPGKFGCSVEQQIKVIKVSAGLKQS